MPQGFAKKIEIDLLLANLALQLGDLPACRRKLVRRLIPRARSRPQYLRLARATDRPQAFRPSLLVLAAPVVQPLAISPDRAGHRRHSLALQHPGDGRSLLLFRKMPMLLHPVPLYEKLSAFSCLTLGGRYTFFDSSAVSSRRAAALPCRSRSSTARSGR